MKTLILTLTTVAALAATASSQARPAATLTIRHEAVGCHSWSLNGGVYSVEQTVRLREGQSLRVVNYDSSAHRLLKTGGGSLAFSGEPSLLLRAPNGAAIPLPPDPGGPAVNAPLPRAAEGVMGYWGATATASFHEPGAYLLSTVEGDAFAGQDAASSGPDNTLTVHVLVFPLLHHPLA